MTTTPDSSQPVRSLEIEITFDVDADTSLPEWTALEDVAAVEGPELRDLDARYVDLASVTLGRAGYAVRRRTGGPDEGWHIKGPKGAEGGRIEQHWPLGDGDTPPLGLVHAISAVEPRAGATGALVPIARIRNARHAYLLRDAAGGVIAEFVDDHVIAEDLLRGVETRWREWEFELGSAAPTDLDDRVELLSAATDIALAAGARRAGSDSKLARALGA